MNELYQQLKTMIDVIADDVTKASGGNKAAGVRVRKVMQAVKKKAQEIRQSAIELKSS